MARQADDTNIVREIFTAELRAEAQIARLLQQLFFQLDIAERLTVFVTFARQAVVIFGRGEFNGFQRRFRRRAANHERHVVRRAGRGAERAHFLHQISFQLAGREQRFGFLVQIGFVRGAAALGDTQELIFIAVNAVEVDLRRQVGAGVDLFVHIERRVLRIAQVILGVGLVDALRQRGFIAAAGPDALAFFAHDDGGAGVLAGRQNAFGGNLRVAQELQRDIFVVFAGFRVAQNIRHLLLMRRAQHKRGVVEGVAGQQGQRLRLDFQDFLAFKFGNGDVIAG